MLRFLALILVATLVFAGAAFAQAEHEGRETFLARCAGCHGLDGRGGEHAPNIATDGKVQGLSDAALLKIVRNGIPGAGMPAFGSSLKDEQIIKVVQYLRSLQGSADPGPAAGDAAQGRVLFFGKAKCSECHMIHGQGGFLAADLSAYARGRSAAAIHEAIIEPNKNLDRRRGTVTVRAGSGQTLRGIIRNEDNFSLQMQTPDGGFHFFDKSELAEIRHESVSLMPTDYGSRLSNSELNDLVRFLSDAAKSGPAVRPEDASDEQ